MIFVTVGTQKFQFNRLLEIIDQLIENDDIKEEVFAQIGNSDYEPKHYKFARFLNENEFQRKMKECDFVISHAGVGSIMTAFQMNKKLIVVPRDEKYNEHVDNHQSEIASAFFSEGYLLMADDYNSLKDKLHIISGFQQKRYLQKKNKIVEIIDTFLNESQIPVLLVGSDLSVKGGIVSVLENYLNCSYWKKSDISFVPTHIEGSSIKKVYFFINAIFKIKKKIKSKKIKIVHLHVSERGSFIRKSIILRLSKHYHCKVILHHHGAEFEEYYQQSHHKKFIAKILEMADLNIVLSHRLVSMIKQINSEAEVEVLYNAVVVNEKNLYSLNSNQITMLGRLEERKGTFKLLETIKRIDNQLDSIIKFNLCGDGDLNKVKKTIFELGLEHRIAHIGWISGREKEEILKHTMCHVLFSNNEGLPMAILETMGLGIVNIATNVASIPEVIINRETGILVSPGNVDELAQALLDISNDSLLRRKISNNAHNLIYKNFSLETNISHLESIYQNLIE